MKDVKTNSRYYNRLAIIGVALPFLALTFSFNYRVPWLLYDFSCFLGFILALKNIKKIKCLDLFIFGVLFLYVLVAIIIKWSGFVSILSVWDTYKHFGFIYVMSRVINNGSFNEHRVKAAGFFLVALLIFQVLLAYNQKNLGYGLDDVSGTFGTGSSHSTGYFSIFVYSFICMVQLFIGLKALVIILLIYLSGLSENPGVLVVFSVFIFWGLSSEFSKKRYVAAIIAFIIVYFLAINSSIISDVFSLAGLRLFGMFSGVTFDIVTANDVGSSRGPLLAYAYKLGGAWGIGPGRVSDIYGFLGSDVYSLYNSQINISEASHLVAEYGVVGFILTIFAYYNALKKLAKNSGYFYLFAILVASFFYNRCLMDERLAFFLVCAIYFQCEYLRNIKLVR